MPSHSFNQHCWIVHPSGNIQQCSLLSDPPLNQCKVTYVHSQLCFRAPCIWKKHPMDSPVRLTQSSPFDAVQYGCGCEVVEKHGSHLFRSRHFPAISRSPDSNVQRTRGGTMSTNSQGPSKAEVTGTTCSHQY